MSSFLNLLLTIISREWRLALGTRLFHRSGRFDVELFPCLWAMNREVAATPRKKEFFCREAAK